MKRITWVGITAPFFGAPLCACQTPDNLVPNCGFTADIAARENETAGSCVHNTSNGSSVVGNITCTSFAGMFGYVVRFRRCVLAANGVSGDSVYRYGADTQLASGSNVSCTVEVADFTCDNCQFNVNAATTPLVPASPPNYAESSAATYALGALAVSAHVRIACNSATAFQVRVDDVFVGVEDAIFKNGFETP